MLQSRKKLYPESPRETSARIVEIPPPQYMNRGFRFSLYIHSILFLCLIGKWGIDKYWPSPELDKSRLPKKSIRVDVVDLPSLKLHDLYKVDLTKEAEEKAPIEAPKKEETAQNKSAASDEKKEVIPPAPSKDAMVLPGAKEKNEALSGKERLAALQKKIREDARRQEVLSKFKKDVEKKSEGSDDKRPLLAGNILSKGGGVQGEVANEADEFTALIQTHVRKFWAAPPWAAGQKYKTRVLVKLSPAGRVLPKQVIASSGRKEFDASALEAVEAADPFPAAPEFLKRIVLQEGIECGFPD